ncbi:MAG: hypothetical protein QXV64_02780, partial [Candidatus Anstonellaceae archaeon]
MGLDDYLVHTGVDNLIKLIKEKKKIEIQDAAAILKVPISIVRIWAKTLEDEKIIKIDYSLTKEYLIWRGLEEKEYQQKKEEIDEKRMQIIKKLSGMKKMVDENVEDLEKVRDEFLELKDRTKKALESVAGDLEEAEILTHRIDQQLLEKKQVLQTMHNEIKKASTTLVEINSLIRQDGGIDTKKALELKERMDQLNKKIEEKVEKINRTFEEINKIYSTFEEKIKDVDYNAQISQIKNELNDLKYSKQELLKLAKNILLEEKEIEEKSNQLNKRLEEISEQIVDYKPGEIEKRIQKLYSMIIEDSKELAGPLKEEFNNIKETINNYSNLLYNYQQTIQRLENIQDKYQREAAEIAKIIDMIEDARNKYLKDIQDAKESLGENKQRYEQLLERAKKIEMILTNVDELKEEGKKLSNKLKGLMMETEIVEVTVPSEKEKSMMQQESAEQYLPFQLVKKIELTKKEEEEFKRKKEELSFLIEKLIREEQ